MAFRKLTQQERDKAHQAAQDAETDAAAKRALLVKRRCITVDALRPIHPVLDHADQRVLSDFVYLRSTYDSQGTLAGGLADLRDEQARALATLSERYLGVAQRAAPEHQVAGPDTPAVTTASVVNAVNVARVATKDAEIGGVFCGDRVADNLYAEAVACRRWVIREVRADGAPYRVGEVMGGDGRFQSMRMNGVHVAMHSSREQAALSIATDRRARDVQAQTHGTGTAAIDAGVAVGAIAGGVSGDVGGDASQESRKVATIVEHVLNLADRYHLEPDQDCVEPLVLECAHLLGVTLSDEGCRGACEALLPQPPGDREYVGDSHGGA